MINLFRAALNSTHCLYSILPHAALNSTHCLNLTNYLLLRSATNRYHKFIAAAKKSFYASFVQSTSSKPRVLWKTINNILHRNANRFLPTSSPLAALPQLFATYFSVKISKLHFNLQTKPSFTPAHSLPPSRPPLLHSFTPATLLEIYNLLSQSSDSYCDLDPVPTTVLKNISNAISSTILSIVNLSITTGTYPSTLKSSIISQLLVVGGDYSWLISIINNLIN